MESNLGLGRIIKIIFSFALLVAGIWLIVLLKSIIALLIISAVIAYILDPLASLLEFKGLTRTQATLVIFVLLIGLVSFFSYLFLPSLMKELSYLQEGIGGTQASEWLDKLEISIYKYIPVLSGQELNLYQQLQSSLHSMAESFFTIIASMLSVISTVVIIPFAVFFILKDGRKMKKGLFQIVPNRYFEMALNLFHKIDQQLGGYLRGQFLDALIIGLLSIIALWILGVKYYVLIGVFAGLANMIPYVGPLSGMIMAVSVVIVGEGAGHEIVAVLIAFAIIQLIDNVLVQPLVLAKSVDLHPLVIIFAIITGGQFFGIIGMLIAIPVTGIIKVVSVEIYQSIQRYNIL